MSDKRRPDLVLMFRQLGGKSKKVELFRIQQWKHDLSDPFYTPSGRMVSADSKRFRVRVSGRWFKGNDGRKLAFSFYEFRDIWWRSLKPYWKRASRKGKK